MRQVILAKYAYGYVEVASGSGYRKVNFMDFGKSRSYEAVVAAATAKLTELGIPRETITVSTEPVDAGDDWPGDDFVMGDAVDSYGMDGSLDTYRFVGLHEEADGNGYAVTAPTLNSQADEYTARFKNWLDALNAGTLSGFSSSATPTPDVLAGIPTGPINQIEVPVFTFSGALLSGRVTPLWECDKYISIIYSTSTLLTASASDIWLRYYLNGSLGLAGVIPAGETRLRSSNGYLFLQPGDLLGLQILTATGGSELTIQYHAAPLWVTETAST